MSEIAEYSGIVPTESQSGVLEKGLHFLYSGQSAVLKGSAGTGKTTLLKFFIDEYLTTYPNRKIAVCATTHKAVKVLRSKIPQRRNIQFNTIHSALKLRLQRNENGVFELRETRGTAKALSEIDVFIVDEGSMTNVQMYKIIGASGATVLYSGDHKQLNPVKEKKSLIFSKELPTLELTEILRQAADNPIINLSYNLHLLEKAENIMTDEEVGYVYTHNEPKIVETLAEDSEAVYLAWTNQCVDRMNRSVRLHKYGADVEQYVPGETVIFAEQHKGWKNSDEYKVKRVTPYRKAIFIGDERLELDFYNLNDEVHVVKNGESKVLFDKAMKALYIQCKKKIVKWKVYEIAEEKYATLGYSYALTVHKAQGSEWKTVILNVANIELNRNAAEKNCLLYTGCTRASKTLIIYGKN